jgi:hypothetical protein
VHGRHGLPGDDAAPFPTADPLAGPATGDEQAIGVSRQLEQAGGRRRRPWTGAARPYSRADHASAQRGSPARVGVEALAVPCVAGSVPSTHAAAHAGRREWRHAERGARHGESREKRRSRDRPHLSNAIAASTSSRTGNAQELRPGRRPRHEWSRRAGARSSPEARLERGPGRSRAPFPPPPETTRSRCRRSPARRRRSAA